MDVICKCGHNAKQHGSQCFGSVDKPGGAFHSCRCALDISQVYETRINEQATEITRLNSLTGLSEKEEWQREYNDMQKRAVEAEAEVERLRSERDAAQREVRSYQREIKKLGHVLEDNERLRLALLEPKP